MNNKELVDLAVKVMAEPPESIGAAMLIVKGINDGEEFPELFAEGVKLAKTVEAKLAYDRKWMYKKLIEIRNRIKKVNNGGENV